MTTKERLERIEKELRKLRKEARAIERSLECSKPTQIFVHVRKPDDETPYWSIYPPSGSSADIPRWGTGDDLSVLQNTWITCEDINGIQSTFTGDNS